MPPRAAFALDLGGVRAIALRGPFPILLRAGITGDGAEARTAWVHVGYPGTWNGHPKGPFSLTSADFRSCVAWSDARQTPIPWDYNHASLHSDSAEAGKSAGYVLRLEVRDTGLWALTEFTPAAAAMIRGGEYRFCSGVFLWDHKDPSSGKPWPCVLRSIAMTNEPFVDGQRPIALSMFALDASGGSMKITKDAFLAELKKLEGDELDTAQLHALVEGIAAMEAARNPEAAEEAKAAEVVDEAPAALSTPAGDVAAADSQTDHKALDASGGAALAAPPIPPAGAPASPPAAPMPMAPDAADPNALIGAKLVEVSGLSTDQILAALATNPDGVKQALTAAPVVPLSAKPPAEPLSAKPPAEPKAAVVVQLHAPTVTPKTVADPAVAALSATVVAQATELSAFRTKDAERLEAERVARDTAVVAEVDRALTLGKLPQTTREHWLSCARHNIETFRALTAQLPELAKVPLGRDAPKEAPGTEPLAKTGTTADAVPVTDPRFVALRAQYEDERGMGRFLPKDPAQREARVVKLVRDHLAQDLAFTG